MCVNSMLAMFGSKIYRFTYTILDSAKTLKEDYNMPELICVTCTDKMIDFPSCNPDDSCWPD